MSEIESKFEPHGSLLPENNLLDPNAEHSLLTATSGFQSDLDSIVKKRTAESDANLANLRTQATAGPAATQGDLSLRRGRRSPVLYNPDTQQFAVAGKVFDEEDYQSALDSKNLVLDPEAKPVRPDAGNWRTISSGNFLAYINEIENPTRGELFKRNFEMGTEQLKSLGGSALAAVGFEETGMDIAEEADRRAAFYQPFVREFTEIKPGEEGGAGRAVDWFVSVLGSQGPQILESIAAAGVGAVAGTATAGPGVGTFGGFVSGLFGKKAFKESVKKAAAEYRKRQAKGMSRKEIMADIPEEVKLLKQAGGVAGATVANVASGYTMGVGDIFGEAKGEGFDTADARVKALFGAIPYAGLESLPEVVAAARLLGAPAVRAARKLPDDAGTLRKAASKAGEVTRGAAGIGALEGVTEAGQESINMLLTDQDLTSPEAINRLINAAAAGVAVGGVMGGLSSVTSRKDEPIPDDEQHDLLGLPAPAAQLPAPQPKLPAPQGKLPAPAPQTGPIIVDPAGGAIPAAATPGPVEPGGTIHVDEQGQAITDPLIEGEVLPATPAAPSPTATQAEATAVEGEIIETGDPEFDAYVREQLGITQPTPVEDEFAALEPEVEIPTPAPVATPAVAPGDAQLRQDVTQEVEPEVVDAAEQAWNERRTEGRGATTRWENVKPEIQREWRAAVTDTNDPAVLDATFETLKTKGQKRGRPTDLTEYTFDDKKKAVAAAKTLGITGFHQHDDGTFMPGEDHDVLVDAVREKRRAEREAAKPKKEKREQKAAKREQEPAKAEQEPTKSEQKPAEPEPAATPDVAAEATAQAQEVGKAVAAAMGSMMESFTGSMNAVVDRVKQVELDLQEAFAEAEAKEETRGRKPKTTEEREADRQEKLKGFTRAAVEEDVDTLVSLNVTNEEIVERMEEVAPGSRAYEALQFELQVRGFVQKYAKSQVVEKDAWVKAMELPKDRAWYKGMMDIAIAEKEIDIASPLGQFVALQKQNNTDWWQLVKGHTKLTSTEIVRKKASKDISDEPAPSPEMELAMSLRGQLWEAISTERQTQDQQGNAEGRKNRLEELYAKVPEAYRDMEMGNGADRISDYFNAAGELNTNEIDIPVPYELTAEQKKASRAVRIENENTVKRMTLAEAYEDLKGKIPSDMMNQVLVDMGYNPNSVNAIAPAAELRDQTDVSEESRFLSLEELDAADLAEQDLAASWDDDGTNYRRIDDDAPVGNMTLGEVQLAAQAFISKLRIKPTFTFVRDAADLQRKNPDLYNQLNEGRPDRDLGEVRSAGASYQDQVVIFTDNIVSPEDLNFLLAHETIGHFGLRSMLPPNVLNAALDKIYNEVDYIRNAVDDLLQTERAQEQNMSKREAIEEYLADMAGALPTNVIARFWNMIKDALRKVFGKPLPDDFARYLISQSRRYVRNGKTAPVDIIRAKIGADMAKYEGMQDPDKATMYALSQPYYAERNMTGAAGIRDMVNNGGVLQYLKDKGIDSKDIVDRVLGQLKPFNYSARENLGYERFYQIMRNMVQRVNALRTKYNHKMRRLLRPAFEPFGISIPINTGMSKEQIDKVNEMLRHTTRAKMGSISDKDLSKYRLFTYKTDGQVEINYDVIAQLSEMGRMSLQDFKKGFTYTKRAPKMMKDNPTEGKKSVEAERKEALDGVTDEKKIEEINEYYDARLESDFYYVDVEDSMPAQPNLTEKSEIWLAYNDAYDTANEADTDLLIANIAAFFKQQMSGHRRIEKVLGRDMTQRDKEFLRLITERYAEIQQDDIANNQDNALKFIIDFNTALIGEDTDRIEPFVTKWAKGNGDRFTQGVNELREGSVLPGNKKESLRYNIQHIIQTEGALHTSVTGADKFAKSSIANGHMPLGREGGWQVYIKAVDPKTGQIYKVHEEFRNQFVYLRTDSKAEAQNWAKNLDETFNVGSYTKEKEEGTYTDKDKYDENAKTLYEIMVEVEEPVVLPDGSTGGMQKVFRPKKVHLVPTAEVALENQPDPMGANLNEVMATLSRFSVQIHPNARERLVKGLTEQNARARDHLQRVGAPGENPDMVRFLSKKLEGVASTVARKEYRDDIAELMNTNNQWARDLWMGSETDYRAKRAAWKAAEADPNRPREEKQRLKREFDRYHFAYKVKDSEHTGNRYLNMASRDLAFLQAQSSVEFSDFASGDLGSLLRMWTTFAQLGGSVATGVLNILALQTNVVPVLATYNSETNFGGGFGLAKSQQEMMYAMSQVKSPKQSDADFWYDLLVVTDDPDPRRVKNAKQNAEAQKKAKAAGFTQEEVQFMYDEVREGTMAAALMNALLGSARGKVTSGAAQKSIEAWMSMFSYTEQAARRGTGLAAFRLYYARGKQEYMKANNITDESKIPAEKLAELQQNAKEFATDTIDQTLGEYAMFNRPAFWRGDVRQFVFMYKMFPLVSIMLFSQMPRSGKLLFLGTLLLLGGIKGLPFAEDLMDLVDTIAQGLGLGPSALWKGSAERTVAELVHAVHPDLSPLALRGLANTFIGVNVSDRVSVGNIIPGTGLGLAGADMGRELMEVAGPIASFVQNSVVTVGNAGKYMAEVAGLRDDTTTFTEILRESPFTMARAFGDMMAYNEVDAIVNSRGYVVDEEVTFGNYLGRALGFYPASATRNNDVVRVSKRINDYTKEMTAAYRARYISAKMRGDDDARRQVVDMVKEWNEVAKGSGLEIRNFVSNSNRAYQLAKKGTAERFRKTVPTANRDMVDLLMEVYGFDE